ncbi:MAG: mechanosensitive ion channel [Chloroflexota bacterium]|nr:mechanosensitive ion channel [Chloroflexota bacterium]
MDLQGIADALTRMYNDIVSFLPDVANGLIVLLVGYVIARIVGWLVRLVLARAGLDGLSERRGIAGGLRGLGIGLSPSRLIAQTVFGLLFLSFAITAVRLMRLETVAGLLERLLDFLPNVIAALLVFLLGSMVARLAGNWVLLIAAAGGLGYARQLGSLVQYAVGLFVVILALGVLGIQIGLLVTAITILLGAFGLGIGLALGLGARNIVYHILAGYYVRQRYQPGQTITLGQMSGEVSGTGSVNTVVTTDEGSTIVPNGVLLESTVRAARDASPETRARPE